MGAPASVDLKSLGDRRFFVELGSGGEGRVYAIPGQKDVVYKEFLSLSATSPDTSALATLIDLRNRWSQEDRDWLDQRTVWPRTAVMNGALLKGFLMPRIAGTYFRKHGVRTNPRIVPCEWNYLSFKDRYIKNPNISSEVPRAQLSEVLNLIADLSRTIEILHSYDIVLGDISGRNLLWTNNPAFRCLIIDNDSFRFTGSGGVASPKQSPDWEDPHLGQKPTSVDSDIYKLALAAYRGLWSAGTNRPSSSSLLASKQFGVPDEVVEIIQRSTAKDGRPTAQEWVSACKTQTLPSQSSPKRSSIPVVADSNLGATRNSQPVVGGVAGSRPVLPMRKKMD